VVYILTINILIPKFIPRRRSYTERDGLNNTAFVLIQEGLIKEAHALLSKAIAIGRGDSHSFANYGLVRGLEGDTEGARKHFDIAKWWARTPHERAVIAYNEAILLIHEEGPKAEIINLLRKAFALSRSAIAEYCDLNVMIKDAAQRIPDIWSLIEREKNRQKRWRSKEKSEKPVTEPLGAHLP
jgi:tetratricopeptide (TPR) repeat protein